MLTWLIAFGSFVKNFMESEMTKTEIIAKIEDLFEQLRDNEYNSWYNRTTFTSWENSYEYTRYSELNAEQEKTRYRT